MSNYSDFDHDRMEEALSRGRKHDIGKHAFFDTVAELVQEEHGAYNESVVHDTQQDFTHEALEVRQQQFKTIQVQQYSTFSVNVPVQIAGFTDGQTRVSIFNGGNGNIFIGPSAAASFTYAGFRINPGQTFSLDYTGPLWYCADGAVAMLSVLIQSYGAN